MNSFDPPREPTDQHSDPNLQSQQDYSERLLHELRESRRTQASRWLSELVQESIVNNPDTADCGCELDLHVRMFTWLERMFDEFERYISEFNASAAATNLFVSSTRPSWNPSIEAVGGSAGRCQGHLTTRFWSMYFRVQQEVLEIYILPADMLLAFNTGLSERADYQPFLVIEGRLDDSGFFWNLDNVQIENSQLPALAKELFSDFIRIASGKATEGTTQTEQPPWVQMVDALSQRADLADETAAQMIFEPPSPSLAQQDLPPYIAFEPTAISPQQPLLSVEVAEAIESMCVAIDDELCRLSSIAGKAAQMSDLRTLARCKRLVLGLSYSREQLAANIANLRAIAGEGGGRAVA